MDAGHLVFDRQSADFKKRTIYVADATNASRAFRFTKMWKSSSGAFPATPAAPRNLRPDGKWIAFLSDRDGWDHLYVMPAAGGEAVQITKGKFEAWRPVWSHDGKKIAFDANEPDQSGDRRLGIADLSKGPSQAALTYLTAGRGTDIAPVWSLDDTRLVYQHSDAHHSADLFAIDAKASRVASPAHRFHAGQH